MKKILFFLLSLLIYFNVEATNYYVNASIGNDANNGTSTSTPWKTTIKVNASQASLIAGDEVLFNRGDIFYGSITPTKSGSSGNPITYGAYGTGANPIISGFNSTAITWTSVGTNLWESVNAVSTLSTCNMVVINGVNTPNGRYPSTDYLAYTSPTSTTITCSSLNSATTNWTGAQLTLRLTRWNLETHPITAHSGTVLTFSGGYTGTTGFGFFIQNDVRTLTYQNAWFYNTSTKKLRIYSTSIPTNVQVPVLDELGLVNALNYITFDGIIFQGVNTTLFENRNSKNVIVQNCQFNFSGRYGIWINSAVSSSESMVVQNNAFNDCNQNAMWFMSYGSTLTIQNNTINNTGMIAGTGNSPNNDGDAIVLHGTSGTVAQYNTITNTGHIGITLTQQPGLIARYNYISNFGMTRYDAGGIYSYNQDSTIANASQRIIDHNIILNSNQTKQGIGTSDPSLWGVYLDGFSKKVTISNNTVSNCSTAGIFILDSGTDSIYNNTCYNNGFGLQFTKYTNTAMPITGMWIKNNILFAKTSTQVCFQYLNEDGQLTNFGYSDYNYTARPIDDNLTFTTQTSIGGTITSRSLTAWQTFSGKELNSTKSPKSISTTSDLRFEYNATSSPVTITLDANYIDVANVSYNGTLTLQPYISWVGIKNGSIIGGNSPKIKINHNNIIN